MAASTWTWLGGTGLSTTAANWSLTSGAGNALGYPAPGDTVIVPSGIIQDGLSELSGTGFVTLQAGAQIQVTAPGDSMSLGSVIGTSGTLTVTGAGSLLDVNGSALALFLGNAGTGVVNVQNAGSVVANTLLMGGNFSTPNGGKGTLALTGGSQVEVLDSMAVWSGSTLSVDPSSGFDMGNIGNFIGGAVIVDPGQTLTGDGLIAAALINNGVVQVNASHAISNAPGTMEITGAVSGSGTLSLAPASVLKLDGAVAASQNVVFQSGGGGALILNNVSPGTITNSISGLNIGDAINFAGLTSISNVQVSGGGGTVTVTTNLGDYVFNNVTFAPGAFHGFFSFFNGSTGDWQIQVAPQQVTWTGATNTDLGVAANWNPNGIPTTIERTNFNLNAGGTLTGTGNESSAFFSGTGTWTLQGATLNLTGEPSPPFQPFAGSDSGKLTINGGALTGGGSYNISAASGATITAQGGAQVSFQGTNLGTSSGQEGDLQVTGAGTTWRNVAATLPAGFGGFFNVGNAAESATGLGGGVGHVTITAGASMITTFNDTIAGPAGSEGDISVTAGGSLSDSTMTVGNNGSGTLTVNGGAVTSTAFSSIGAAAAGNGAATISGNGVWNAQSVDVAQSGRGTMTVNTGTLLASGNVIVGASSGALGVASVTTGTIAAGGGVQIGSSGTGTATVNAGGTILSGGSSNSVGANPGGVGELRILGGGIFRSTVAAASSSSFNIGSSGTSGTTPGALGAVVVSGLGSQLDMAGHGLFVGNNGGTGSLIVAQGGTVQAGTPDSNVSSALQVGAAAGGSGAITVTDTGSVLDVSGFGLIGQSGFGKLVVKNSGSVAISAAPANGGSFFIGTGFTGTTSAASRLGGSGEVDVTSSGALTTPNAISVGGNGNAGVLNVNSGGGVQVGTSLSVAPASLITGTIYGGTGQVNIGAGGTINITGTPTTNFPAVVVGTNNASLGVDATGQSQGILTISGAGALLDTGGTGLTAGAIGQGTILISQGGSLVLGSPVSSVQGAFNIARYGNASLTITDPGSQITSNGGGYIGRAGDGALVVENHAIFNIGTDPTGSGGLGLGGAGFLNNNTLAVSGIGTGLITGSGTLTVASNINVGQNGSSGSLTINNGGYVSTAQRILIAQGTTIPLGGGILATASGTTAVAANTVIGSDGGIHVGAGGTLIASGGSITAAGTSAIGIAGVVGTTGHLDVSGAGALVQSFASRIGVGTAGDATMSVSQGGTVLTATPYANDDAIYTGFSLGATGVVTVTDPGSKLTATGQFAVGVSGQGSLLVENQGTVFTGSNAADASQGVEIAQKAGAGGTATVTGANSLLTNTGRFVVGDGGLGGLSIAAGGAVTTTPGAVVGLAGMVIANASAASGSAVNVTGANSNLRVTGSLVVGNAAYGQLSISQSATVSADNVDAAASAGGDGAITVTDAGSALNISGLLTVGDQSSGSLNIVNGATVTAGGLSIGTGASGSGNVVIGPGSHLTLTGTTINVGLAGSGVLDVQGGTLALVAGTTLSPGTFGRIVQVGGLIDPATVFDASGGSFGGGGTAEASGTIVNSSLASVSGGAETLLAPLITSSDAANVAGVWSIKSGGTLVLDVNTFDNSQTISFGDLTGVLTIGQQVTLDATQTPQPIAASALSGFAAPIVGYKAGDKITFNGLNVASDQVSGNVVTLFDSGNNNLGSLTFQTSKGGADKAGATAAATQITQGVTCFAEGTRIETENGPQAVETLREGDLVVTRDGTYEPVVWIGQRAVNCAAHPRPETVWPVRVAAGAFGDNVPVRDLYLSPDHAVFVNDVLVPVKLLINSTSITSLKRDHVTYFHVELPRHDVILAEGLTVESYLDLGDRTNFERGSGTIRLHPDFTARLAPDAVLVWETRGAAKLVMAGQALEVAREFLAGQAGPSRGHGGRDVQAVS